MGSFGSNSSNSELISPSVRKSSSSRHTSVQELYEKIDKLNEAIVSRDMMLMSASHECRNPLNGIHSNLELSENILNDKNGENEVDKLKPLIHNAKICGEVLL